MSCSIKILSCFVVCLAAGLAAAQEQQAVSDSKVTTNSVVAIGYRVGGGSTKVDLKGATLLDQIVPPDIPTGLPSQLLERRPDILAAEQEMRFANAQVGVATANFFPRIGLTALLGRASSLLDSFASLEKLAFSLS
jgi:outer membrane protein TolC